MKKLLYSLLLFLAVAGTLSAQPKMITISEDRLEQIVREEVAKAIKPAVDAAVLAVAKEYELKIIDYKQQLIDKDIVIVNTEAERDKARAEAVKFENLYKLEKSRQGNWILITIGTGIASGLIGYGISLLP